MIIDSCLEFECHAFLGCLPSPNMTTVATMSTTLWKYPETIRNLPWAVTDLFVRFTRILRREIELVCPENTVVPPLLLPGYIHDRLAQLLDLDGEVTLHCWEAFRYVIWESDPDELPLLSRQERDRFFVDDANQLALPISLRTCKPTICTSDS